jgi:predicted glutamine amidotransferase
MCGIAYAHNFGGEAVNNQILDIFDSQRSRGTDGFGLFDGKYKHIVKASKEDAILKWLVKYDSNLILFHHRWPTSSANTKRNAHPFSTQDYFGDNQYILVHNGHISNASELKEAHEKLGIKYATENTDGSFNDSEALLWDFALFIEGKQKELAFTGSVAFVCLKLAQHGRRRDRVLDKLYFARNSNPLVMKRDAEGIVLASTGEGEPIDTETLYTYNYPLKRLTKRKLKMYTWASSNWESSRWNSGSEYTWDNIRNGVRKRMLGGTSYYEPDYGHMGANPEYLGEESWEDQFMNELREQSWEDKVEREVGGRLFVPNQSDIEKEALAAVVANKGSFEKAHASLEDEYRQILDDWATDEEYRRYRLLEEAMMYLCEDPEWENEHSISSIWSPRWKQLQEALLLE